MRKVSLMMVAALFAIAMPARAADPTTAPCEGSSEYTSVGLSGAHEDVTPSLIPGPSLYVGKTYYLEQSVVRFTYRIDVSGSPAVPSAQAADVRIVLGWDNDTDFDIYIHDAHGEFLGGSDRINLVYGSREAVFLGSVPHCTDLRIDVVNSIGLPPDEMTLDTTLEDLE